MVLKVAAVQQQVSSADKLLNLQTSSELVRQAATQGAQLVVLQELHTTHYFCQTQDPALFDLAEPLDGPARQHLEQLAKELNIVLVGSIFEKRAEGIYHNTALVFDGQAGLKGIYRKMHIPDDPGFCEKFYFTPGDSLPNSAAFAPIQTSLGRLGVLVCWDQWYPEAARLSALQGADILIYPTAIGWDPADSPQEQQRQREAWTIIQRSHAVANHLPVIVANRTGFEKYPNAAKSAHNSGIEFWGQSFICGQQGEFLAIAQTNDQGPLLAELDLSRTSRLRRIWPYFRDRRIDSYKGLQSRYLVAKS